MRWTDLPLHPAPATLRRFGGLGCLILAGLAFWQLAQDHRITGGCILGVALLLGALVLAYPAALRPVFVGLMVVSFPINWLVSRIVLAVIFFGVFTPLGLCFRLFGRDVLARRSRPAADSYWTDKPRVHDVRSYFRQS